MHFSYSVKFLEISGNFEKWINFGGVRLGGWAVWAAPAIRKTRFPEHVHLPLKRTNPKIHISLPLNNYKIVDEEVIKAALAAIESEGIRSIHKITKEYNLVYITLL